MRKRYNAIITGAEKYLPEKRLTNFDLERMVDTSDEWIRTRTGISERRILEEDRATSDMAAEAARRLLERREVDPKEIELIVVGTVTPDMIFPATACLVQEKIGATNAWGFDLSAGCCGFLYALVAAAQFVETGAYGNALVIGADKMSSIVDYTDRTTCVLFGDGAGAVLLEPSEDPEMGILDRYFRMDGAGGKHLFMPGGGSLNPSTHETVDRNMHCVHQDGRTVYRFAAPGMAEAVVEILSRNGLTGEDIALLVPHQANLRIIEASGERAGIDPSKVMINIDRYGNTTSGTIPIGLTEAYEESRFRRDDLVVLASFGAGFTWGSILLRWAY